jgi:penicillin amidase
VGIPHQNVVLGDRDGHVAWTIFGRIPEDTGWTRARTGAPYTTAADHPRILDPASGRLWTANARVASEDRALELIGGAWAPLGSEYDLGARAGQIRDDLMALKGGVTPKDMLAIQLDDRALFLERWQHLLLGLLDEQALANHPERAAARHLLATWDARASTDSVGYRLVRAYRTRTEEAVFTMLLTGLGLHSDEGQGPPAQFEGPLWRLVNERPMHLLAAAYRDWPQFLLAQLDETLADLARSCPELARCTWGARNVVRIHHPLSPALPGLAAFLDMPTLELPGDHNMPRVQDHEFGSSERFAVSPGHEEQGYLELPGGQSGHPLSPYYRAGFLGWAHGELLPFLPGPAEHTLLLTPD